MPTIRHAASFAAAAVLLGTNLWSCHELARARTAQAQAQSGPRAAAAPVHALTCLAANTPQPEEPREPALAHAPALADAPALAHAPAPADVADARDRLSRFLEALDREHHSVPDDQREQLLALLTSEQQAAPPPREPADTAAYDEWQAGLDQRIRDRAQVFLPPEVLQRLELFQARERVTRSLLAMIATDSAPPPD